MKKLILVGLLICIISLGMCCGLIRPKTYELEIRNNTNSSFTDIKLYTVHSDEIISFPDVPYNSIRIEEMRYSDVKSYEVTYELTGLLNGESLTIGLIYPYDINTLDSDAYPTKFIVEIPEGVEDGTDIIVTKVYGKR